MIILFWLYDISRIKYSTKINKKVTKEHLEMTKAKTLAGVHTHTHTHTHTGNFIEIKEGRNTFICNIKNDRLLLR